MAKNWLEICCCTLDLTYLTQTELEMMFGSSCADSRYSKVKRLLAQGKLLYIRRGLYCLTEQVGQRIKPHPKENVHTFFVAKPWKAICDYIYCYKKDWKGLKPLVASLRIEAKNLPELSYAEMQLLKEYYQHKRISQFLQGVHEDFQSMNAEKE